MTSRLLALLAAAGVAGIAACSEISSPARGDRYEWRLFFPRAGGGTDTLGFRWGPDDLPVRVWAEDEREMPARARRALETWQAQFLYGELEATMVADSNDADVIILVGGAPAARAGTLRLARRAPECSGVTEIDVPEPRDALVLPIRVVITANGGEEPAALSRCLDLTVMHEIGHALGIFEHSPDADDLMFANPNVEAPSARDRNTVERAYHFTPTLTPVNRR